MNHLYSYKFRLYPSKQQEVLLNKHFGCGRFVYNHFLDKRIQEYKSNKKSINRRDNEKELPSLKKENPWLKEVGSQSLQYAIECLQTAYDNFFRKVKQKNKGKKGFPRFKRRNDKQSFRVKQNIKIKDKKLCFPKFLSGINFVQDREFNGEIKFATISKNKVGFILFFLLIPQIASAGLRRAGSKDSDYVDAGAAYPYVVPVQSRSINGLGIVRGSAVIINPEWMLTAGHVLDQATQITFRYKGKQYGVSKTFKHPNYNGNADSSVADIALLKIDGKLPEDSFAKIEKINELEKIANIVGCGISGSSEDGILTFDGIARAGTNKIDQIIEDKLVCTFSRQNMTEREYLVQQGDSGGGVFIDGILVAIHSVIEFDQSGSRDKNEISYHVRVQDYLPWINQTIDTNKETAQHSAKPKKRFRPRKS